jgi:hypothetical protein
MPNTKKPSGTGNAEIKKQGHTATTLHGTNPDMKAQRGTPRDLGIK